MLNFLRSPASGAVHLTGNLPPAHQINHQKYPCRSYTCPASCYYICFQIIIVLSSTATAEWRLDKLWETLASTCLHHSASPWYCIYDHTDSGVSVFFSAVADSGVGLLFTVSVIHCCRRRIFVCYLLCLSFVQAFVDSETASTCFVARGVRERRVLCGAGQLKCLFLK